MDGDVALEARQQLMGDEAQLVVAHHAYSALVIGRGVVESDLVAAKPLLCPTLARGADRTPARMALGLPGV